MGIKNNSWKVWKGLSNYSVSILSKYDNVLAMFVGKCLLYEVQCVKHEHSTQIQRVYYSELRLL